MTEKGWEFVSGRPSMTGGEAALKARGCPPICFANRFPPRPLARREAKPRGPDSRPATRRQPSVLDSENDKGVSDMGMVQSIGAASDRVMAALVSGLEIEFGRGAGEGLAARFLAAEECDFYWDGRSEERWLGNYESADEDHVDLDRVAILGRLDGHLFVATCIVDGDEIPHGMTALRRFGSETDARNAFSNAH